MILESLLGLYRIFYVIILALVFLLANRLGKDIFKPYTYSQKKRSNEILYYKKKANFSINDIRKNLSSKFPVIGLSEDDRVEIQKKIDRLGLSLSVEEIRQTQVLYAFVVLVIGLLIFLFVHRFFGFLFMLASIYAWKYPIWKIDDEIKRRNDIVASEVPKLYMVMYYSYKHSPRYNFIDKVQSFMKHTNDVFYWDLQLLVNDAKSGGEIYALRQFKKRVPIGVVMRFCDIMETRLEGYDNIGVMQNFKEELDQKRQLKEDEILEKTLNEMNNTLKVGVMFAVVLMLGMYFFSQFIMSFRGL